MGPAGSARQMLPPTVATFQILNDPTSAVQHSRNRGTAVHCGSAANCDSSARVQVAATSSPTSVTVSGGQPNPVTSTSSRRCTCGSEYIHVPPARTAVSGPRPARSARALARRTDVTVCRSNPLPFAAARGCRESHVQDVWRPDRGFPGMTDAPDRLVGDALGAGEPGVERRRVASGTGTVSTGVCQPPPSSTLRTARSTAATSQSASSRPSFMGPSPRKPGQCRKAA